jgi:hypothetical protein
VLNKIINGVNKMNTAIKIMDEMIKFLSEEATKEQESNNLIRYYVVKEQISIVKILKVRIQMENKKGKKCNQ